MPFDSTKTILNLGCGRKKRDDAVNVDITPDTEPDVICNLDKPAWPFPDNHFTEVLMYDVIEHLTDLLLVMGELHRICKVGAVIHITTPHFSSANSFTDPTHRHHFGWQTLDYFTGEHQHNYYTRVRFRMQSRQLVFHPSLMNKLVWRLANRFPEGYERKWAWTFPAWFLLFDLEVVK